MLSDAVRQLLTAELSSNPVIHEYDDFADHRLRRGDVTGAWAGYRQLAQLDADGDVIVASTDYGLLPQIDSAYLLSPLGKIRDVNVAGRRPSGPADLIRKARAEADAFRKLSGRSRT